VEDDELRRWLLNGAPPKRRKERRSIDDGIRSTPVTDPDLLDPYERLLFDEHPDRTKEQLALYGFQWGEHFTYEEAARWFAVGATHGYMWVCREFRTAGVPPEVAGKTWVRRGVDTGMTIFRAVAMQRLTAEKVREIMDARARRGLTG
jgi:hypothetical protein